MTGSIRHRVAEHLLETLRGIRTDAGFATDLGANVQRGFRVPDEVGLFGFGDLAALVDLRSGRRGREMPGVARSTLSLVVHVWVGLGAVQGGDVWFAIDQAVTDVEVALSIDESRGGLATDTRLQSFDFAPEGDGSAGWWVDYGVEIELAHDFTDPRSLGRSDP